MSAIEPTPAGLVALQPQHMTPEQIADLVARTRSADAAAGTTPEAHARMVRGGRKGGQATAKRYQAERAAAAADLDARERYQRLMRGARR